VTAPALAFRTATPFAESRARACAASSACLACSAACICAISSLIEERSWRLEASCPSIDAFSAERCATSFACST
jgi:hypothetical protein